VLCHQHVTAWRRHRGRTVHLERLPDRAGPDESAAVTGSLAVRAALARLAPRRRAAIVLRYFEDLTEAQTADILGCRGRHREEQHPRRARAAADDRPRNCSARRPNWRCADDQGLARRLAETAEDMAARVPADLWRRGKRRHRTRRLAALAACVVVSALADAQAAVVASSTVG
jgi:hypothetical protein